MTTHEPASIPCLDLDPTEPISSGELEFGIKGLWFEAEG